ncbi:ribosome small subunit-dependent GTPase A [Frankia sp. CiP3]|uniref:ribosome small subunit-dependent GTPase A n=1 Tax=Frankia sp. CiP3 TaxID=2880971 RepID=UPI001EF6D48B|nr:ribosome small subunit-dependent GTPase A [Frankia sp. CiP3]
MPRELDEDDVRVRAGRGSRPRTRERPDHADAVAASIVAVDRGRYTCHVTGRIAATAATVRATRAKARADDGSTGPPQSTGILVAAVRGGSLRRTSVIVGDEVALVGDVSGSPGSLARIVARAERRSVLRRTADDTDPLERPIVANADRLIIVCALTDPPPRTGMIDRCLVAAYDGGLEPVLCLTKADLADDAPLRELYGPLGFPVVTTRPDRSVEALTALLRGRVCVLFGHSGVGKSTLVNRLVPDAAQTIGAVNAVTGRGRHTSSAAIALPMPGGGWVVDTPGVRSFGLGAVRAERVLAAFPDLAPAAAACPGGCTHQAGLADCAVDRAVDDGLAEPGRLASLRRLLVARSGTEPA